MKKEYRVNFMTTADYAKNCANDYARVNSQAVVVTAENAEQATEQVKAMFPAMVVFQGVDLEQEKEYNAILTADLEKKAAKNAARRDRRAAMTQEEKNAAYYKRLAKKAAELEKELAKIHAKMAELEK